MERFFPHWNNKNIRAFYVVTILANGWFVLPNWMFLYAMYISKQQIGFVEAAAIILGIVIEVPTGVISDVFGKKRTLIAGHTLIGISAYIITQATAFPAFLLGNCFFFIGMAFISGSFEAFAYDSLVEIDKEEDYDKVTAKSTSLGLAAFCISVFSGGLLFGLNATYPFYAWTLTSALAVITLFFTKEPKIDSIHASVSGYIQTLKDGVITIFSNKFTYVLFPIIALSIIVKLNQGVVRQSLAIRLGFTGETFSYVIALSLLPALFITHQFDVIRKKVGSLVLLSGLLISFALLFVFGANIFTQSFGVVFFILFYIIEKLSQQINSVAANERIESKHRATALSVIALIAQAPYVLLMFFFSDLTSIMNISSLFMGLAGIAAVAGIYSFYSLIWNKK